VTLVIRPSEIKDLAPMPASVSQLLRLASDRSSSMADMSQVIEYDEALTANLLRLANSVWGGSRVPVMTVKDAVVRLGTAQILKLAVGQQIAAPMTDAIPGYQLAEHEHWRHSVASALAAEHLGRFLYKPIPGLPFTASLLHDIGKLVVGRHLGHKSIGEIRLMMEEESVSFIKAEHEILGTDHAEVGASIARHWKFPDPLVAAIELHHDPDKNPNGLLDVVHTANIVAKLIGLGLGSEEMKFIPSAEAPKRLGLTVDQIQSVCLSVVMELDMAEKLYRGDMAAS
jgi:putative nucleotidyltransferase with HDIG domain